jgi:hypothetical protein
VCKTDDIPRHPLSSLPGETLAVLLKKLKKSPKNVRKTQRGDSEITVSIETHRLLQLA